MLQEKLVVNFRLLSQIILLSCLLFFSAAQAQIQPLKEIKQQVQISTEVSDSILTPGQSLTLTLSVTYTDGMEIYFAVKNVDWQKLDLLNFTEQDPVWKSTYWQKQYLVELIAPGVGDYLLPAMKLDVYQQDEYQQLTSKVIGVTVQSSYMDAHGNSKEQPSSQYENDKKIQFIPELQSIELAIDEPTKRTNFLWLLLIVFLLFAIFITLRLRHSNSQEKRKQALLIKQQETALSPIISFKNMMKQFESHFEKTGVCDWLVVQAWLNEYIVVDPFTKALSADETRLMAGYQSIRYAKFDQDKFNHFCIDCYAYLSNDQNIGKQ